MTELEKLEKENVALRAENDKYRKKFIELLCAESPEQKIIAALKQEVEDLKFALKATHSTAVPV